MKAAFWKSGSAWVITSRIFGNYTYSKAFDTTTDFNSDFGPQDNTNLAGERGLSDFDQRHKVVLLSIIDTGNGGGHALFSGFQISPIFRYNSGHPFNLLAGADVNGDRHSTNDRPIGVARNTGLGPDFFSFDMRLSRRIKLGERSDLQFLAEGFNLANRTNYRQRKQHCGSSLPGGESCWRRRQPHRKRKRDSALFRRRLRWPLPQLLQSARSSWAFARPSKPLTGTTKWFFTSSSFFYLRP